MEKSRCTRTFQFSDHLFPKKALCQNRPSQRYCYPFTYTCFIFAINFCTFHTLPLSLQVQYRNQTQNQLEPVYDLYCSEVLFICIYILLSINKITSEKKVNIPDCNSKSESQSHIQHIQGYINISHCLKVASSSVCQKLIPL